MILWRPQACASVHGGRMTQAFGTVLSEPGLITYLKVAPNNPSVYNCTTKVFLQAVAELDLSMCTLHGA